MAGKRTKVASATSTGPPTMVPDPRYRSLFDTLFSQSAAQYAFQEFAAKDQLGGAYSSDLEANVWRLWREASRKLANGRPLEAFRLLKGSGKRFPLKTGSNRIAEAERLNLIAECLASGNQLVAAAEHSRAARDVLRRFLEKSKNDRASATEEVRKIVEFLTSTKSTPAADEGMLAAWLVSRGVHFACTLAQRIAVLPRFEDEDDDAVAHELEADVRLIQNALGSQLESQDRPGVLFALGDIYTQRNPERALQYFDRVAELLGPENGLGLRAAANAAGSLMQLGRLKEAEGRYASMESIFEMIGDYSGAARVWMSECVANWKRLRDPKILHSLTGAIEMYEQAIPAGADVMTRYEQKQYIEPGYMLLVAVIAHSNDRSDEAVNQLLSGVWALLSRDALANLKKRTNEDSWSQMLFEVRQPLAAMKMALSPNPGLIVVHLLSVTDSMVWLAYGYDNHARFRFECAALGSGHGEQIGKFIATMHEELEADRVDDGLACAEIESELQSLGEALTADLPGSFRDLLKEAKGLIYMPHPYGNVDEFPLGGLRIDGRLLGELLPIVRSPSVMHLRETLSPNRAKVVPQENALVVLGAQEAMGQKLQAALGESGRLKETLESIGFGTTVDFAPTCTGMEKWLNGSAGALHYIGHGMADNVNEGLPLSDGEVFGPINADRLDGFRVPFVFLCACMAARVRSGRGGYQTGVASKLAERGAPGVIAFLMPITEKAAYSLSQSFYRAAAHFTLAEASVATMRNTKQSVPLYARLAFTTYGDAGFQLKFMPKGPTVPMLKDGAASWASALRAHCVLRTEESRLLLARQIKRAPEPLVELLEKWCTKAFQDPASNEELVVSELEQEALETEISSPIERMSIHAAALAEILHRSGIESIPIYIDTSAESVGLLLSAARFLAEFGAAIFDARLNGLGNSLIGRVVTVEQNDASKAALFLRQGREKLLECEHESPFVTNLREGNRRILEHFGLQS